MKTKEFLTKFQNDLEKIKSQTNATVSGFAALFNKITAQGALTIKQKELVAMGIAVSRQCEPCIRLHAQKCPDTSATERKYWKLRV